MKRFTLFTLLFHINHCCFSQDTISRVQITDPAKLVTLTGQLGKPLGSILSVEGVIVDRSSRRYEGGLNLAVETINDSSIQERIIIPVTAYFEKDGNNTFPELTIGTTYRLRVYESGEFVGSPENAAEEAGVIIQTRGFYFQNKLMVLSGKKIKPVIASAGNFTGRYALIAGTAENAGDTAVMRIPDGELRITGYRKWPNAEIGKLVEVYGKIEQTTTAGIYMVNNGHPRLVKLEDQLGMSVTLRGRAMNMNACWWFNYRGTDIYVEKMEELPAWTAENHYRPMEITGVLEQAVLPRIDQITLKSKRDTKLYYIVRKPGWKPIEQLLAPEDDPTEN